MKTINAWILRKSSAGGSKLVPVVYFDKDVAQMYSDKMKEEWADFIVTPVKVRILNETEGAVDRLIVELNRETAADLHRRNGLKKLTKDERKALGL